MERALAEDGFILYRQKGSHRTFVRTMPTPRRVVTVPRHKTLRPGTQRSIFKQAGWDRDDLHSLR